VRICGPLARECTFIALEWGSHHRWDVESGTHSMSRLDHRTAASPRFRRNKFLRVLRELNCAAAKHEASTLALVPAFLQLCLRQAFSPKEIFRFDLLFSDRSREKGHIAISKERSLSILAGLNPPGHACLTEDKIVFYRYCTGLGLPIPELLATIEVRQVYAPDGGQLTLPSGWESLLGDRSFDSFVIKPAGGVYARGVQFYRRSDDGFRDANGVVVSAQEVYTRTVSGSDDDRFVVQELIRQHPELKRLSGGEGTQTARFTTFVDRKGNAQVLFYMLKVICGDKSTDNFDAGASGNLIAIQDADLRFTVDRSTRETASEALARR